MAIASLIVSVIALIGTGFGIGYARKSAKAADRSALAAGHQAAIEQQRYHADLTPQLRVVAADRDVSGDRVNMTIELTGPPGLDRLEEVTVRIRDDIPDRKPVPGNLTAQQDFDRYIWGPYRILPGLEHTDRDGRQNGPFRLLKNEPKVIPLERSLMPAWMSDPRYWRDQYDGTPVRLEITCKRNNDEPWVVATEVTP